MINKHLVLSENIKSDKKKNNSLQDIEPFAYEVSIKKREGYAHFSKERLGIVAGSAVGGSGLTLNLVPVKRKYALAWVRPIKVH